ncbi:TraR/DksA C4-type zinc finger protein [Candidatus Pacearchaeota archaeon]|nr:TraR/DksA C4-type zinc finger protein [Candidatus Pacearchaeota archaeon]
MDQLDHAKNFEMMRRDIALQAQIENRLPQEAPVFNDNNQVICKDCSIVIPPARLEARPESVRCVDCKTALEKRTR